MLNFPAKLAASYGQYDLLLTFKMSSFRMVFLTYIKGQSLVRRDFSLCAIASSTLVSCLKHRCCRRTCGSYLEIVRTKRHTLSLEEPGFLMTLLSLGASPGLLAPGLLAAWEKFTPYLFKPWESHFLLYTQWYIIPQVYLLWTCRNVGPVSPALIFQEKM